MSESNLEKLIDDWLAQSKQLIIDYFAAKEQNNTTQVEIYQKAIDKIAQQFITGLKAETRSGGWFFEKLRLLDDYFLETSELAFDKLFNLYLKTINETEEEIKKQAISGIVNSEVNKKIAIELTQIIKKEETFLTLFESLLNDFKYPIRIIDKIRNSKNLVKWIKFVCVKIDRKSISQIEYKDINDTIDRLFSIKVSGDIRDKKKKEESKVFEEYINVKVFNYYNKAKDYDVKKKAILAGLLKGILQLEQFKNVKFTIHDVRNIIELCNQLRYMIEEEKEILTQIKVTINQFKKFINASKHFSIYFLNNVNVEIESESMIDVMEIQGKIKRVSESKEFVVPENINNNNNK
ncbi:MAG TPA: hypothetical protein PLD27_01800 [bacterium]|nr:hypothetical protein [bacterium]HOL47653.1 hypothetical protein [bacterium]HPQ18411.1 hypothetical protein [bacterium]